MTLVHRCFDHGTYEKKHGGKLPKENDPYVVSFWGKKHGILPMPGWISIARGDDHINQTWICQYMYYVNVYIYIFIYIRSCRTMILIDFQQVFVVAWLKHLGFECSWIEQGWGFTNGLTQCWPNVGPDWWCWLTKTPVTILQSIINHRLGLFSRWFGLFSQWEIHHDWGIYSEYFYFLGTP